MLTLLRAPGGLGLAMGVNCPQILVRPNGILAYETLDSPELI
jgi:hypothetical protein